MAIHCPYRRSVELLSESDVNQYICQIPSLVKVKVELEAHVKFTRLLRSAIYNRDHELCKSRFTPNSLAAL